MITLWNGYCISSDAYQYILGKPTAQIDKRTNKLINSMDNATYHKTVGQALTAFHGMMLRESIGNDLHTLQGAINASKDIEERIKTMIKEPDFNTRSLQQAASSRT